MDDLNAALRREKCVIAEAKAGPKARSSLKVESGPSRQCDQAEAQRSGEASDVQDMCTKHPGVITSPSVSSVVCSVSNACDPPVRH